jgi:hypothetical protein
VGPKRPRAKRAEGLNGPKGSNGAEGEVKRDRRSCSLSGRRHR